MNDHPSRRDPDDDNTDPDDTGLDDADLDDVGLDDVDLEHAAEIDRVPANDVEAPLIVGDDESPWASDEGVAAGPAAVFEWNVGGDTSDSADEFETQDSGRFTSDDPVTHEQSPPSGRWRSLLIAAG